MAKAHVAPIISKHQGKVLIQLYTPHRGQKRLHASRKRFRVMACGRRWGKSLACANELVKFMVEHKNVNCLWVAPVYKQCKLIYRLIKRALKEITVYHSDSELRLELFNGSTLDFYSVTSGETLRGGGYDGCVIDESQDALADEAIWYNTIRPTLMTTQGWAIFIGTPKGYNFFHTIFQMGLDPLEDEWESFTFPTSDNPYVPRKEIEAAKKEMPEDVYDQEILAKFLDHSAGVFRAISQCIQGEYEEVIPGNLYISQPPLIGQAYCCGWDVAKYNDFSVATILNATTMHVDAMYRLNLVDYKVQVEKIAYLTNLYNNASVLQDATGVGDPVLEMLKSKGVAAEGFVYTNISKKLLIEELQVATEHRNITFPDIPVLIGELKSFQYKLTRGGFISYEAPKGYHDDCVNSLALAKHAVGNNQIIPIGLTGRNEDNPLPIIEYENRPELMQRQAQVSKFLGDVQLVYGDNDEGW